MMTRTLLSLLIVASFLIGTPSEMAFAKEKGARIVYSSAMQTNGQSVKMQTTYLIQGGAVRFESKMLNAPDPAMTESMTMIANPKSKKYILLLDSQKTYMELPPPSEKQVAKSTGKEVPFKPTGKMKKFVGYDCEVFARTLDGRSEEVCASKALKDVFDELEKGVPQPGGGSGLPEGLNGLPMEYIVKPVEKSASKFPNMEMRVTEFKREKIAKSKFEVPKGYEKQLMPSFEMKGAMNESPKAMKKAEKKAKKKAKKAKKKSKK